MSKQEEDTQLPPPFLEEILKNTDGGAAIYEHLVDGVDLSKRQKADGLYNPSYTDTNPSLSIYWSETKSKFLHFDHGTKTGGDALQLYRDVRGFKGYTIEMREELSRVFMQGARTDSASDLRVKEELELRARQKRVEAHRQFLERLKPQPICWPVAKLIEWDRPTILHELCAELFLEDGLRACALYHVSRGSRKEVVKYPIASQLGHIHAFKRTEYRREGGRITKKRKESSKEIDIGYEWPDGLTQAERRRQLFGAHLVPPHSKRKTIAIVEAEDVAVIATASGHFKNTVFMASGGQQIKREWIEPFKSHNLIVIPDLDAIEDARRSVEQWWKNWGIKAEVRVPLQRIPENRLLTLLGCKKRVEKADLADFIVAARLEELNTPRGE